MPTGGVSWFVPSEWFWVSYPVGWMDIFNWIGNAPWPGERQGFPRFESDIMYARLMVRELCWVDMFKRGDSLPDVEFFALGGIHFVTKLSKEFLPELLNAKVAALRRHGYSWTDIGTTLGVRRTAAHKRFGSVNVQKNYDDPIEQHGLGILADQLRLQDAAKIILRDLVIEARCDGSRWADIGDALGVRPTAAHKRFSCGLTIERVTQLDAELEWMATLAPDGERRRDYKSRLSERRRHDSPSMAMRQDPA